MTENHVSSSAAQALQGEWHTLQNNHERYEAYAVAIKLLALVFAVVGLVVGLNPFKLSGVLAVLWLQEGILRTSQARLAARLMTAAMK